MALQTSSVQTSSEVVAGALGFKPDGVPAKTAGHCAYCGQGILPGHLQVPFSAGPSFMDASSLAARGSPMVCGHCAVLLGGAGLAITGYGVFHQGGVQPFRKWADIRSALIDPPDGPFVMLYATAKQQHMAWRAVVNYSRDLFYVRVGLRDLKIRRPVALKALETAERMGRQIGRVPTLTKAGEVKSLPTPFLTLSSDLKDFGAGLFPAKVWSMCAKEDIAELMALSVGELWAMRFLCSPGAGADTPQADT